MSGGGKQQQQQPPMQMQAPQLQAPPPVNLQTGGYGGMGYTPVPQTYTQESAPSWMRGGTMDLGGQGYQGMDQYGTGAGKATPNWYQMPQWGTNAVTGQPLTQQDLMVQQQQPQAPVAPPSQAQAPSAPNKAPWQMRMDRMTEREPLPPWYYAS